MINQHISASCTLYVKELHMSCELRFDHLWNILFYMATSGYFAQYHRAKPFIITQPQFLSWLFTGSFSQQNSAKINYTIGTDPQLLHCALGPTLFKLICVSITYCFPPPALLFHFSCQVTLYCKTL